MSRERLRFLKVWVCAWILLSPACLVHGRRGKATGSPPFFLDRLSQTYLPSWYTGNKTVPRFCLGSSTAEQVAFDPQQLILYVAGFKLLHVMDLVRPEAPWILGHIEMSGDVTDVAVCGGIVAVSIPATPKTDAGHVELYSTFTRGAPGGNMKQLHKLQVGALPDMLTFTQNCNQILVANEGEAGRDKDGNFANPEGSVSLIDVKKLQKTGDASGAVNTVGFSEWNDNASELSHLGVRWGWRGQTKDVGNSFSADLEPEYIAVSMDGSTAYIILQENNAVAVMDIHSMNITSIHPLGLKDFGESLSSLDGSSEDNGPQLKNWPLYALYQPDTIAVFEDKGKEYLATANEGSPRYYDWKRQNIPDWNDVVYGSSARWEMDSSIPELLKKALEDPSMLGNFRFSSIDGWEEGHENEKRVRSRLVGFGGRSFSIFDTKTMQPVFDSKDELERLHAELFPWSFNSGDVERFCPEMSEYVDVNSDAKFLRSYIDGVKSDDPLNEHLRSGLKKMRRRKGKQRYMDPDALHEVVKEAMAQLKDYESSGRHEDSKRPSSTLSSTPADLMDKNSPLTGIEPESLVVGSVGSRRLLFISTEKASTVAVYDITNPRKPVWQSSVYPGRYDMTWAELFNERVVADIDPEGMEFIPEDDSPTGEPLLVVAGSLSGTVSIYRINKFISDDMKVPKRVQTFSAVFIPTTDSATTVAVNGKLI